MKRILIAMMLCTVMVAMPTKKSHAIIWKVVTAAVKKVVKAMDLQIQRQQNKVIWLQNAQKTLENTLSKLKLKEIGQWTQRQRDLYKGYYEELQKVKKVISGYKRIREIARMQQQVIAEYRSAWEVIRRDKHFSGDEILETYRLYQGLLAQTAAQVADLSRAVTAFSTSMSDFGRLEIIVDVEQRVSRTLADLRQLTWQNKKLSMQRAKSEREIEQVELMYGL